MIRCIGYAFFIRISYKELNNIFNNILNSGEQIECSVEGRLEEIRNITVRLPVLSMIPETIRTSEGKEAGILRLFSGIAGLNSTLVHPNSNRPILLSIYSSPVIVLPGLFVRDARCMNRIESLVSRVGVEGARFSLVVRV